MPKRTHADALETRRTILQSALNMFSEKGYEKTSLSDIARDAGVTRGAIYWHFEDKGELLYELCLEVTKEKRFPEYILMASKEDEEIHWAVLENGLQCMQPMRHSNFFHQLYIEF